MYKPWYKGVPKNQQPQYHLVKDCTQWTVLGSFNNRNIVQFSHKETHSEYIDKMNQFGIYSISEKMDTLVQKGKYGAINTTDKVTMGNYDIKFLSES